MVVVVEVVVVVHLLDVRHVDPSTSLESIWTLFLCVTLKDKEGGEGGVGLKCGHKLRERGE